MERIELLDLFNKAYDRGISDTLNLVNKYCDFNATTIPELIVLINKMKMEAAHD